VLAPRSWATDLGLRTSASNRCGSPKPEVRSPKSVVRSTLRFAAGALGLACALGSACGSPPPPARPLSSHPTSGGATADQPPVNSSCVLDAADDETRTSSTGAVETTCSAEADCYISLDKWSPGDSMVVLSCANTACKCTWTRKSGRQPPEAAVMSTFTLDKPCHGGQKLLVAHCLVGMTVVDHDADP
jgi:hypothetical protein